MSWVGRTIHFAAAVSSIAVVGIIFAQAALPIINTGKSLHPNGPFTGPMSDMTVVVPGILGACVLGLTVWFVVSPAQREKRRQRRGGPPR